ncbi:long-chain fatty acid--CoA ligase [Nocardioides immobilis]|uniref:Long-chain fatty acid--CoA ligase n=1 Tax=Nocardioides immobilis TaxID=2049295 RepID=A0A417Y790_9ACTN|nr:class I adenylate-forming enzyme family protein [Nocardioides immobilis]RHW28346.1 long-chain fatty acid--CoA ligase [Nocardioides immobilis]
MNIAWWLERAADEYPDHVALVDGRSGSSWTYAELRDNADRVGTVLRDRFGVRPGEVVATLLPDDLWHTAIFFGLLRIGAVFSGFNRTLGFDKFAADVTRLETETLVAGPDYLEVAHRLVAETGVGQVIDVGTGSATDLLDLVVTAPVGAPVIPRVGDDPAAVNFTGGTSGVSKGVVFTHGSLSLSAQGSLVLDRLRSSDVNLSCISLYHSGGIHDAVKWTMAGATNVLTGGWDADVAARLIEHHAPTWIYFWVPTMVRDLERHPRWGELPLAGVRTILCGEPVSAELQGRLIERGMVAQDSYGMSETMPVGILKPLVAHGERPPLGSCGRPVPELCETVLKDPETGARITEPGIVGEVCVRGGVVSPGYYNDPARTAEAFDAEGFLHTRDVASFDADGWWFLGGRTDDIINSGGEKLSLVEVEAVLRSHPDVLDVACVSVAHERFGEVPAAVIVTGLDEAAAAQALDAHCLHHLERWKRPRLYAAVESVPRTMPKRTKDMRALRDLVADIVLSDADNVSHLSKITVRP